jgi:predicted esterase
LPDFVNAPPTASARWPADTPAGTRASSQSAYLIIHGTHDEAVPIERARAARSVLEARGAIVEYHEHRVGHKVSAQGMKEIAQWLERILS